jgi:hypothetical protein
LVFRGPPNGPMAHPRTSSKNFVDFPTAPSSQELEFPEKSERFSRDDTK